MDAHHLPSVGIITPSNRQENLRRLIEIYLSQDYPNKSLSILSDGIGYTKHTDPGDNIWHWGVDGYTIGAKRNELIHYAKEDIIVMFDDDDFYAPDFITQSVNHLLASRADVTGLSKVYFFQQEPERAWLYEYSGSQPYIIGSGMCYYKSVWERNKFQDVNEGEDRLFLANAGRISPHNYTSGFCAFIHGKNTASHKALKYMKDVSVEYVKGLIKF